MVPFMRPKMEGNVLLHGQQPGNGASAFGDHDLLTGVLDFIQEMKALSLELAGRDLAFHTMVILP